MENIPERRKSMCKDTEAWGRGRRQPCRSCSIFAAAVEVRMCLRGGKRRSEEL